MLITQISVFIENQPGKLGEVTQVLADNGVDMSALSLADTTDFGILRLIVNDPDKATAVLRTHDFIVKQSPVIAAVVDDRPGGLTEVLQILSFAGVSVEYMYAFVGSQQGHAVVVMRTDRAEAAMAALESHHVNTLDPKDIYRISPDRFFILPFVCPAPIPRQLPDGWGRGVVFLPLTAGKLLRYTEFRRKK